MSVLKVEFNNYICEATVNRPHARNAINFAVMDELDEVLYELESNSEVRCFILKGGGHDAFISGGDLNEFHTFKTAKEAHPIAERILSILRRIETLP